MNKKYQILIQAAHSFPFNQVHHSFSQLSIQVNIKFPVQNQNWAWYQKKIKSILYLQNAFPFLIKLSSISEDRINHSFNLIYQYVEYSLDQFSQLKLQISVVEQKISQVCQFLLQQRILPCYNISNFGFNKNKQLKYILLPNFILLSDDCQLKNQIKNISINVKNMLTNIKYCTFFSPRQTIEDDKTSQRKSQRDLSAYSKKFEQKISSIQNRLLLNKHCYMDKLNAQKIKRRKKFSQNYTDESYSVSSSSENSLKNLQHIESKQKDTKTKKNSTDTPNQNIYSKTQTQKFYNKSLNHQRSNQNSSTEDKQSPQSPIRQKQQKLTNSLIIKQSNADLQRIKHHKSSFGDYSNYGNESQKQVKLKRRISYALQKSQNALKTYEKFQSKRASYYNLVKKA